jgi:CubicO group peptidase (beta-lactamase class C family)
MATLVAYLDDIQHRLDALARRHRVPGATLAISRGDELLDFATGVLNLRTQVPATTDSVFQIGSNTKIMTTTLIMQLVDDGKVELDAPVQDYVPSFELAVPGADQITVRQLLTHTSGIQGDHFEGYGRGDEAIGRYVESLRGLGLVHPPGQLWSYCNTGFVLAGYVAEQVTGLPYHQLLRERISGPAGLASVAVLVEDMAAARMAVGHLTGADGRPAVAPTVIMEYAAAPAGSRTAATAADLARFTRIHLAGGLLPDGSPLLSAGSAAAMQSVQHEQPPSSDAPRWQGLGWMLSDWGGGVRVIGHGGGTIGQTSFLQAIPEQDLVITLLTNADAGEQLWESLGRWLFETLADVSMPRVPRPADPAPDLPLEHYTGTYERLGVRQEVTAADGVLILQSHLSGPLSDLNAEPPPPRRLRPVNRESFYIGADDGEALATFSEFDESGRPGYLFIGRLARRVS